MVAFVTLSAVSVTCMSARVIKPRTKRLHYRCTCRRSCPHHACARKAGKTVHALAQCHLSTMHNCAFKLLPTLDFKLLSCACLQATA
jgi:hypothetical protein